MMMSKVVDSEDSPAEEEDIKGATAVVTVEEVVVGIRRTEEDISNKVEEDTEDTEVVVEDTEDTDGS